MVANMRIRNRKPGIRTLSQYVVALVWTIVLTFIINLILLFILLLQYRQYKPEYMYGGTVMEELTLTQEGYELSDLMRERLTRLDQWAMLLDENGQVIWSFRKPAEIKDSYSRSDIANMCRWYLQDYPVYLRVWDDKIMVVARPKDSMWKYNIEFPVAWIKYMLKTGIWLAVLDFIGILALMAFLLRRGAKDRELARIEWIAGISHDIRTPLSMVMGYVDMLERNEELAEEERREAAVIRHQSIVMKELIEDLNLTSRLEYSMQPLRMEKVCLVELARQVVCEFLDGGLEERYEIAFCADQESESVSILGDEALLKRALGNLIQNSIVHNPQGCRIAVSVLRGEAGIMVDVADDGAGVSAEMLKELTADSHHLESTDEKLNLRHGLGVLLVRQIVEVHKGTMTMESAPQKGFRTVLTFPA